MRVFFLSPDNKVLEANPAETIVVAMLTAEDKKAIVEMGDNVMYCSSPETRDKKEVFSFMSMVAEKCGYELGIKEDEDASDI